MRVLARFNVVVLVAAILSACTHGDKGGDCYRFTSGNKVGSVVPVGDRRATCGFTGDLLGGGSLSLSQDVGKVVVVNFWASWCVPCAVETPQLDAVYRANETKGIDIVGIAMKDTRGKVESFVDDNKISYPIVLDEPGAVAGAMGSLPTGGLPFSVVVDKHQRVAAVYLVAISPKDLQPVLDRLIAEA